MALFCGVFFMDVISTAPRHNIDDSLKCSGVKGSLISMQKGAKKGQNAQFRIHMWKAEKISWLWPRVALSWKIFGSKYLVMIKMTFKDMMA